LLAQDVSERIAHLVTATQLLSPGIQIFVFIQSLVAADRINDLMFEWPETLRLFNALLFCKLSGRCFACERTYVRCCWAA
jgi:hypothetical protein